MGGIGMSVRSRAIRFAVLAAGVALAAPACGTKTEVHGNGQALSSNQAPTPTGSTSGSAAANQDKPRFTSDFERTCADGIGFGGVAAYSHTKGIHPTVLMTKSSTDSWIDQQPSEYPTGWLLGYQSDLSKAELVACYERVSSVPAGKVCDMEDDKTHTPFKLTMYNTQYRLRILEAQTGKVVFSKVGMATSTDCPSFVLTSGDDDRTKYYTDLQPRDYRAALKPYIAP